MVFEKLHVRGTFFFGLKDGVLTVADLRITYCLADQAFAARLAEDLTSRGLEIFLDQSNGPLEKVTEAVPEKWQVLVLSRSSMSYGWLLKQTRSSVLPVVIEDLGVLGKIAEIKYANFSVDYSTGLNQLLRVVAPAEAYPLYDGAERQFAYAYQGTVSGKRPSHLGCVAVDGGSWSFAAAIESAGDRELAPRMTGHICQMLLTILKEVTIGKECLSPLLRYANLAAMTFRMDTKLAGDHPLGAKIAAMVQFEDQVLVGTVGTCGSLMSFRRNKEEIVLITFYSNAKLVVETIDNGAISVLAPLGHLNPNKQPEDWADSMTTKLMEPGDLVALATFRFSQDQNQHQAVARRLNKMDAVSAARLMVNSFAPPGLDSLCCVALRS